jgi:hypothetical protein
MGDLRLRVEGIPQLELETMKTTLRYTRGYRAGLEKALDKVYRDSQELVPVDTGALKSSGRVEVTGTGFNSRGYVAYGGPVSGFLISNVHYSVIVHEAVHKTFRHGQAKFLQAAIERNKHYVRRIIRDNMRKEGLSW